MGIRGVGRGEGRAPRTVEDFVKNLLLQDLGKEAFWPQNQIKSNGLHRAKLTSIWHQNLEYFLLLKMIF